MSPNTELKITPKGKKLLKEIWKMKHNGTYLESDRAEARFGLLALQAEAQGDEPDFYRSLDDLSEEINADGAERPSNQVIEDVAESLVRSRHLEKA